MSTSPATATVRELIVELADLEDAVRGMSGPPGSQHRTLIRRQARIVRELRRRRRRPTTDHPKRILERTERAHA